MVKWLTFKPLAIRRIELLLARSDSIVMQLSSVIWERQGIMIATIFDEECVLHFEV
jgi:hypothetical protein